jgi:hypothetical protein
VPDTWKNYGVPELAAFNKLPTYSYASPHNIQRWTKHTKVDQGQACFRNCHLLNEDDVLRNKEIYLFEDDLEPWEKEATAKITVDKNLPKTWRIR